MKRDFKNLIGQNDFKTLYENEKIEDKTLFKDFPINESMDLSNNTNFSQSLIGRIMNRMFSIAATKKQTIVLNNLKNKIADTYLKAISLTFSTENIIVAKKEKVDIDEEKMFELLKKWAIEKAYKIVYENETKSYTDVYDVYAFSDEQIELWKQAMEIEIEILDSEIIKAEDIIIYNVKKDNAVDSLNSVEQHIEEWEFEDSQKEELGVLVASMQPEIDDTSTSDEKKTALKALQAKIVDKMNIVKSQDKNEIQLALPAHSKHFDDWIQKYEANVISKNMKKVYAKLTDVDERDKLQKKMLDVEQLLKDEKYAEIVSKYSEDYSDISESKSYNKYDKLFEDSNSNPSLRKKADQLYRDIVSKVTGDQKEKYAKIFNKSDLIKNLPLEPGDTEETKKAVKNSGGDISNFEKTMNASKNKKDLFQRNIDNVNKELLKIYQLKAKHIYTDPNDNIKTDALKHLNFTISPTDRAKLENKWEQSISKVKSQYMDFFSDNGTFPKILDPIALVESDKSFRSSFSEHGDEILKKVDGNGDNPTTKEVLDKLKIKSSSFENLGLLEYNIDGKKIILLVKKFMVEIENKERTLFALKEVYDFDLITKKVEKNLKIDDKELKEYITDDTKLRTNFSENKKILNKFIYNGDDEKMKKYFSFNPNNRDSAREDNIFLIVTSSETDKTMKLQIFNYDEKGDIKFLVKNSDKYEYVDDPGNIIPGQISDYYKLLKDYDEVWDDIDFHFKKNDYALKDNDKLKKVFNKK